MKLKNENFYGLFDRGRWLLIEDIELNRCTFTHCGLSLTTELDRITTIRRALLTNCALDNVHSGPLVASEVAISNLTISDLMILWCPYLDRVSLSGDIGKVKINAEADPSTVGNDRQKPFDDYRTRFYSDVEWALDISEARFKEFDVRGIPGHLIRRDPESQVLITRERALKVATPGWERQLDSSNKLWPFMINLFLKDGDEDAVFVAPIGAAKAKRDPLLKGLQELRRIGLTEPD